MTVPIYEFVCPACGYEFEKIQTFSDTSVPGCPQCQNEQVQRRMGRPAIHFKGSGWYITDSKADNKTANKDRKDTTKTDVNGDAAGATSKENSTAASETSAQEPAAKAEGKAEATAKEAVPKERSKPSSNEKTTAA